VDKRTVFVFFPFFAGGHLICQFLFYFFVIFVFFGVIDKFKNP